MLDVVACASVLADAGTQIRLAATVASRTCLACLPSFSLARLFVGTGRRPYDYLDHTLHSAESAGECHAVQEAKQGTKKQSLPVMSDQLSANQYIVLYFSIEQLYKGVSWLFDKYIS